MRSRVNGKSYSIGELELVSLQALRERLKDSEYYTPKVGWLCYIDDEAVLSAFKTTGWSAGIAI